MTATLTRPALVPAVVAGPLTPAGASLDFEAFRAGLVRLTVDGATRMVQAGILPEDVNVELLDGLLVRRQCGPANGDPYVEGSDHNFTVAAIGELASQISGRGDCHLRTQSLLVLSDWYAPYPDAMVLRGPAAAYRGRRPTADDVICLIEVADSSYARDAGEKRIAYATAGVGQYIIIDLQRRLAEVHAEPDRSAGTYPPPVVVLADGSVPMQVGKGEMFAAALADLLP